MTDHYDMTAEQYRAMIDDPALPDTTTKTKKAKRKPTTIPAGERPWFDADAMTIVIPFAPPWELTPNRKSNRTEGMAKRTSRYTKQVREVVGTLSDGWPFVPITEPVTIDVTIVRRPSGKPLDDDGAKGSIKAILDGLQDAGVWANDRLVTIGTVNQPKRTNDDPDGGLTIVHLPAREWMVKGEGDV